MKNVKENRLMSAKKFADEIQIMASSLVEDVKDSESMTEAWQKIDNFYRDVEAKRNFQKCTGSKSFSVLESDVEGHTKYLQGLYLPIMVNSIWDGNKLIPSEVAEMHIGQHNGRNVLFVTSVEVAKKNED